MREKLQAALDWLRGFLEAVMGPPTYDDAAIERRIRDLVEGGEKDERPSPPDR